MKDTKIGWKIVFMGGSVPESAFSIREIVKYSFDNYVMAPAHAGPLCLFATRRDARKYFKDVGRHRRIYKCLYKPGLHNKIWNSSYIRGLCQLPIGTVLADAVKLLNIRG